MDAILEAQKDGVVLGLKGISDTPVPRLDIDDLLFRKPDAFNLFLLAIGELQEDQYATEKLAWQQVAGIHGLPKAAWDGVGATEIKKEGWGYCAHSRPTFPSWHRPYMAMMEQTVYVKMAEIADRFPDQFKPRYKAALKEFRFPYWDYYRPRAKGTTPMPGITGPGGTTTFDYDFSVPQIFVVEQVMVRRYDKNDELHPIPNPLRKFSFPKTGGLTTDDWTNAKGYSQTQTVRYPESTNDLTGSITKQSFILNRQREPNVKAIRLMIKNYDSYASFASDSLTPGASGSLEDIHGDYHGFIGGGPAFGSRMGHMSYVPTAAFDPIFWMHHCLIDRFFAIWQAAHPEKWYDGEFEDRGKKTQISTLATENALPFRHPQGGYWNGDLSRYTKTFGYVYTDAVKDSPEKVIEDFEKLYSWATRTDPQGDKVSPPPELAPLPITEAQVFQYSTPHAVRNLTSKVVNEGPQVVLSAMKATGAAAAEAAGFAAPVVQSSESVPATDTSPVAPGANTSGVAFTNLEAADVQDTPAAVDESKYHRDWFVDNVVKRLALNGPFAIFYFIGKFDGDDISNYAFQPTMAGVNYVFTSSREACDNCGMQDDENLKISGTKVITPMLMDYIKIGKLQDLTPANVVPFLIQNLKWRIVDQHGDRQDPRQVAGFQLGVSSSLNPISGDGRPIYEEYPQIVEQIIANSS